MTDFRKWALVGLLGFGLGSLGCSSSSNGSGTGGTTGSTNGTGGSSSTGTGGTTVGEGGSAGGGANVIACGSGTTNAPTTALITDFSDAVAPDGGTTSVDTFGSSTGMQGGVTTFQNPASTAGTVSITGGAMTYAATVSAAGTGADAYPYSGVVVYVNGPACIDASQYTGVSFSISGDIGTCGLVFSFGDAEHGVKGTADPRFAGPAGSYGPQFSIGSMVTSTATTIKVPFTAPTGGSPATPVDPANLTGVQWQLSNSSTATATCTGTITVDDVTFYK